MGHILVDANVLLDVIAEDKTWFEWSSDALVKHASDNILAINPIIYAEVSIRFARIEDLEAALPAHLLERLALPWEAAFLAGKCFMQYRKRGGERQTALPDFFIGAHASVAGIPLMTRDVGRYRTYFPGLHLISPD
jgi:predicted nucleic acid-binding protein